jgi:hypothetical protein
LGFATTYERLWSLTVSMLTRNIKTRTPARAFGRF